jgi:hypothetical protein
MVSGVRIGMGESGSTGSMLSISPNPLPVSKCVEENDVVPRSIAAGALDL